MTSPLVLLPLQAPGSGLTRLARLLSAQQRAELARCMLADVTAALRAAGLERLVALCADEHAGEVARRLELDTRLDPGGPSSLDDAVAAAVAASDQDEVVAVVMPDLPRLSPSEAGRLLDTDAPVVVAPAEDGGTGGLLRRPGGVIPTAYGPDSASRHLELAREAHVRAATIRTVGFAHDVDTVADLRALTPGAAGTATGGFLAELQDLPAPSDSPA